MTKRADWTDFLMEPMAIRGAYGSKRPSLATFVLHALKVDSDRIGIAGEFTELPQELPLGWKWNDRSIAYVIFDLMDVKSSSIRGEVSPGTSVALSLNSTPELWATAQNGNIIYYKEFSGAGSGIDVHIVAAHVRVVTGLKAMKSYAWAKPASKPTLNAGVGPKR